jgi:hypothetical protein
MLPELAGDAWWGTLDDWDAAWTGARSGPARAALMRSCRRLDVERARAALTRWWPDLASDDRARVLAAVEESIDASDEPFVAGALKDRRGDVRRTAASLLVLLPDSDLSRRLEDVARPLVESGGMVRKALKVRLPAPTEELEALGLATRPESGYGERAWLLRTLLAHVRPARWTEWLRVDAVSLVEQATRSNEARPLLEGWIAATSRFGDREWATAILGNPGVPDKVSGNVGLVFEGLSPADRATVVAATARAVHPSMLAFGAALVPAPWPAPVGDAVLEIAELVGREVFPGPGLYELVRAAALRLPPERADELADVASYKDELRPALLDVIETIRIRGRIHEAFNAVPPLPD